MIRIAVALGLIAGAAAAQTPVYFAAPGHALTVRAATGASRSARLRRAPRRWRRPDSTPAAPGRGSALASATAGWPQTR